MTFKTVCNQIKSTQLIQVKQKFIIGQKSRVENSETDRYLSIPPPSSMHNKHSPQFRKVHLHDIFFESKLGVGEQRLRELETKLLKRKYPGSLIQGGIKNATSIYNKERSSKNQNQRNLNPVTWHLQ